MTSSPAPEEAIRECPFCGGEPDVVCNGPSVAQMQHAHAWGEDYDVSYYVQCLGCTATSMEAAERSAAIAAWNRRAGDEREAWQPIESAPRDRFIWLWCPEDNSRWLAKWQDGQWYGVDDEGLTRACGYHKDSGRVTGWEITHWRPLPAPPRAALAGQTEGERHLTPQEQRIMHRALRRSVKIVDQ